MTLPTRRCPASIWLAAGLAVSASVIIGCAVKRNAAADGRRPGARLAPASPVASTGSSERPSASEGPARATTADPASNAAARSATGMMALVNGTLEPAPAITMGDPRVVARIIDEGKNRNQVMDHLTYISTKIGPRLTGSSNAEAANRWAAERFRTWGLREVSDPARGVKDGLWKWGEIPVRFDRGPSTAKIVSKRGDEYRDLRELEFTTLAWSAGTNGTVRAPIVKMPANEDEFAEIESKIKGAWVLVKQTPPGAGRGVRGAAGSMGTRQALFAELRYGKPEGQQEEPAPRPVAAPVPSDGISGVWEGTAEGGPIPAGGTAIALDIRRGADNAVTGTFGYPGYRTGALKEGKYDPAARTLTFKWDGPGGENAYTMTIDGQSMKGERKIDDGGVITVVAKLTPPTAPEAADAPPRVSVDELVFRAGPVGYISASSDDRVRTGGLRGWREMDFAKLPREPELQVRVSDYDFINSKLADGWPIEAEANLDHKFTQGPIAVYNTVAEIPGTEKPDEVVIVSAHVDSWNGPGSQGTTDNGTGSSVTLEAARILMAAGAKPKRTIRFVLWTGEEQGLLGSREYVKHLKESGQLDRISAVFVDDGGTNYEGGLHCTADMMPMLAAATAPATGAFPEMPVNVQVSERMGGGIGGGSSDHASFLREGVPAFFWDEVGRADYGYGWHTQNDRIDLAIPEYLIQSSTCAAVTAYNLACADTLLPKPPPPDPNEQAERERRRQERQGAQN